MENIRDKLYTYISSLSLLEGENKTTVPYISVYRYSQKRIALPNISNPYIFFVINGSIRLFGIDGICDFGPLKYYISTINSPQMGEVLSTTKGAPFLALSVEFSIDDVIAVMLDIDGDLPEKLFDEEITENAISCEDNKLLEIVYRLLNMTPMELSFMGKHLKREFIFDLITGLHGKQFMENIVNIQQAGDIYYINNWIKQNYKIDFAVEELAEQSNMSLSSFHQKFKSAVGMGPLQCQKKLRLTEARRLMLDKAMNVTDAAMEVGYESVSQFIRDYRRMFGRSPQKDVQKIRECIQEQMNNS